MSNRAFERPRGQTAIVPARLDLPRPGADRAAMPSLHGIQEVCSRASASSSDTLAAFVRAVWDADTAVYPGLKDELRDFLNIENSSGRQWAIHKMHAEFAVYLQLSDLTRGLVSASPDEFVQLLFEIHAALRAGETKIRSTSLIVRPDRNGNIIQFPEAGHCLPLLHNLLAFVASRVEHHPALCAVVAYACIVQTHPFTDGNGRTARTLYNLILADWLGSGHFLPIHLIASLDQASFLIKLRRAIYGGDWTGLAAFFLDATRLSDRLQRATSRDYPNFDGLRR